MLHVFLPTVYIRHYLSVKLFFLFKITLICKSTILYVVFIEDKILNMRLYTDISVIKYGVLKLNNKNNTGQICPKGCSLLTPAVACTCNKFELNSSFDLNTIPDCSRI